MFPTLIHTIPMTHVQQINVFLEKKGSSNPNLNISEFQQNFLVSKFTIFKVTCVLN